MPAFPARISFFVAGSSVNRRANASRASPGRGRAARKTSSFSSMETRSSGEMATVFFASPASKAGQATATRRSRKT